jgi:hypothetical protein
MGLFVPCTAFTKSAEDALIFVYVQIPQNREEPMLTRRLIHIAKTDFMKSFWQEWKNGG